MEHYYIRVSTVMFGYENNLLETALDRFIVFLDKNLIKLLHSPPSTGSSRRCWLHWS